MAEYSGSVGQSSIFFLPTDGEGYGSPMGQGGVVFKPTFYGGPVAQSDATFKPSFYGGPVGQSPGVYKASRYAGQVWEIPLEQRQQVWGGPSGEQVMALPAVAPVIDSMSALQRDQGPTWLVDVTFAVHDPSGEPLERTLEYSLTGAGGPWLPMAAQIYDRRHTAVDPLPTALAVAAPGMTFKFVWNAYQALAQGEHQVHFRLTVEDSLGTTDQEVIGPVAVSTVDPPVEPTPLERQLAKREPTLDGLDFLGNGLVVPFRRVSRDFDNGRADVLVRSSVRVILRTRAAWGLHPGDLPWRPDFGNKLWTLRHRNNDELLRATAMTYVLEAMLWEPRAEVTNVTVERDLLANELRIRVFYRVITEDVPENEVILEEFEETVAIG